MPPTFPRAAKDFLRQLQIGKSLCILTLPRLETGLEPITLLEDFKIYPQGEIDFSELRVAWHPKMEFDRRAAQQDKITSISGPNLAWFQGSATRISIDDFKKYALIAFPSDISSEQLFQSSHKQHIEFIRAVVEQAERALDIVRFEQCQLDLPDSLPGRAGTFDLSSPYSAALFYFLSDNESYVIAGQSVTHLIAAGIGLQLEIDPSISRIGDGEVGNLARRALSMFTEALESNSETEKFVRAISTLEFIAGGGNYLNMKDTKTAIALHLARGRNEYHNISERFRDLTSKLDPHTNEQKGIRTRIVHMGERLETILPKSDDRKNLFRELQYFISKPINDLIGLSDCPWAEVIKFRKDRRQSLGI